MFFSFFVDVYLMFDFVEVYFFVIVFVFDFFLFFVIFKEEVNCINDYFFIVCKICFFYYIDRFGIGLYLFFL